MLQTMGQSFQEMLAGRIVAEDVISRTQDDWEKYHEELAGLTGKAEPGAGRQQQRRVRTRAPGEPRRVAYLYLAPAFVFYGCSRSGRSLYTA